MRNPLRASMGDIKSSLPSRMRFSTSLDEKLSARDKGGETRRQTAMTSLHAINDELSGKPGPYPGRQATLLETLLVREGHHSLFALPGV